MGGDLVVDGNINFSQIAVNLPGGREAVTGLEVAGGSVIGSGPNETQRKTYSHTFSVSTGSPKDVQLMFGAGAFYAKITTMLRRTDAAAPGDPVGGTVDDISTMVLDLIGGTGDESTPSSNVTIGNLTLFGGDGNAFPWSPVVGTGKVGITMTPYNVINSREYSYDYYIELTTACGGKLEKITTNHFDVNGLDNGNGGQTEITSFDY